MADGSKRSLCSIEAGTQTYYLLTSLHSGGQDGLELTLTDAHTAWQATGYLSHWSMVVK